MRPARAGGTSQCRRRYGTSPDSAPRCASAAVADRDHVPVNRVPPVDSFLEVGRIEDEQAAVGEPEHVCERLGDFRIRVLQPSSTGGCRQWPWSRTPQARPPREPWDGAQRSGPSARTSRGRRPGSPLRPHDGPGSRAACAGTACSSRLRRTHRRRTHRRRHAGLPRRGPIGRWTTFSRRCDISQQRVVPALSCLGEPERTSMDHARSHMPTGVRTSIRRCDT